MKRLLLSFSLVFLLNPLLRAAELSADELKRANDYLKKTSDTFVASTKGLSEAQLKFKTAPERWTIADVAEHITATEDRLMGMIKERVMKAPARTEAANLREIDDLVMKAIADRSNKVQAPEELKPTNRFGSTSETMNQFKASRAKTVAFLKETKGLRDHAIDSPLGKKLDAYQWLLFIGAHSERHTKQILEVQADANFPKK